MKNILAALISFPVLSWAEEKGHSHGPGGEIEHMLPILGFFAVLIVVGGVFYFINLKKK
ncbi:MAG: hypothetical protein K2Q26_16205 [Bdellovibrionales bacterium]|nr:hypothetical protein [Bdellovibrionales bacterium]